MIRKPLLSRSPLHVLRSYEPNLQSGKNLHFLPRSSFNPFLGSSRLSRRVSSLVDYLWPDSLTVFASASMQLVTGIPSPLLCFWTFNGGLSFFHAIAAFRLSSLFSGILSLNFSTDASLQGGSATCQMECISFVFPDCISVFSSYKCTRTFHDSCHSLTLGPSVTRSQIHRSMR